MKAPVNLFAALEPLTVDTVIWCITVTFVIAFVSRDLIRHWRAS